MSVTEFRSQPVSVLAAVPNPGVQQVQGRKTLLWMISLAGGIDAARRLRAAPALDAVGAASAGSGGGTGLGGQAAGRSDPAHVDGAPQRTELYVDLRKVLQGKTSDVPLQPNDVLFILNNVPKNAMLRGLESALQIGTGLATYRR